MNIPKMKKAVADAYTATERDSKIPRWLAQFIFGRDAVVITMGAVAALAEDDEFIALVCQICEETGNRLSPSTVKQRLNDSIGNPLPMTEGRVRFKAARSSVQANPGETVYSTCGCIITIPAPNLPA